jgi:hypothetical protein
MIEGALRNGVVVFSEVVTQRRFELGSATKTSLSNDLADAAIAALDHAVGLRIARRNKPVLDHQEFTENVEGVLGERDAIAGDRVFFLADKAVRKLAAVVGQ